MFGGKFNIGELMKSAQKMQEMLKTAQEEMAKIDIEGESGGGLVKIKFNAKHFAKSVFIDDELLKESKEVIQDLIAAAINNANEKIETVMKNKMGQANQFLNLVDEDK